MASLDETCSVSSTESGGEVTTESGEIKALSMSAATMAFIAIVVAIV